MEEPGSRIVTQVAHATCKTFLRMSSHARRGLIISSPAHAYTYSFEPNPNWSSFYAYAPEIKQYFLDFAAKYDLLPFVKLNSKVLSAVWQEEKGICEC